MSNLVVVLYDFPGKQSYIYRTNAIREVVGASNLIADAYTEFKSAIQKDAGFTMEDQKEFSLQGFRNSGKDCEVIYEGGGNLYMIFCSREKCVKANRIFTRMLLDKTYSLNVTCSFVEIDEYKNDFEADRTALFKESDRQKRTMPAMRPVNVLPFTQIDRKTSLPIAEKNLPGRPGSFSQESVHKLKKYNEVLKTDDVLRASEKFLDDLITKKGTESLLAIIYIDGNNMGEKVKRLTADGARDYTTCVTRFREFTQEINRVFLDEPIREIDKLLEKNSQSFRKVISGGDEITIICNARIALEIVKTYFNSIMEYNEGKPVEKQFSACAGMAICHSHAPYSVIYEIAEQCCENAKIVNRKNGSNRFYFDYQFCHSGVTNQLKIIREQQEQDYTNRPYCYCRRPVDASDNNHIAGISPASFRAPHDYKDFVLVADVVKEFSRGDVKTLAEYIVKGDSYYQAELERLKTKYIGIIPALSDHEEDQKAGQSIDPLQKKADLIMKKCLFDVSIIYDIWIKPSDIQEEDAEVRKDKDSKEIQSVILKGEEITDGKN